MNTIPENKKPKQGTKKLQLKSKIKKKIMKTLKDKKDNKKDRKRKKWMKYDNNNNNIIKDSDKAVKIKLRAYLLAWIKHFSYLVHNVNDKVFIVEQFILLWNFNVTLTFSYKQKSK